MFERLSRFFSATDDHSHDDYFASSGDHAELERRMRQVEESDHAYSMTFCGSIPRRPDDPYA
ncbi:transcriptional regulator [Caballeronia sp. LP006]|uniref:transcriptional regulator n=1 Tax=unclassified Caballeronia TaxID=2646786 RepID=UPI001FCFBB63|nr:MULTISPECIES: transcriptional regulator [unclassified Caballeronia]MDR5775085.1 transcriptional regulator [Caballeronia sp. LZ002]MDR5801371.1 transcriptional regulator [Caballeronia sp. LZ001]MDR5829493.1 transcriptional regulator [Caballeronia sp. LP006]MDR5850522.1 transcriptional regulator [Caballeronia sp. LZ003]